MKSNKGLSIVEALVCLVIIGIGFIAVHQAVSYAVGSIDRSTERIKDNFLSEMIIEDMIADKDNVLQYQFNSKCSKTTSANQSNLTGINKWKNKFTNSSQMIVEGKTRKPICEGNIAKGAYVNSEGTTARVIFITNKTGKKKKYLAVGLK